jgi:phosphoglycerate kinase
MNDFSNKQFIEDLELKSKRVLVRVDFNVPLDADLAITDNSRITGALQTIRRVVEQGGRAVLMSHLGRPDGKRVNRMSLQPAAAELSRLLDQPVFLAPDCIGSGVESLVDRMQDGEVVLLENLRFHKAETKNDPEFCKALATLGEVYVNDAFGTAHRAHASTAGVAEFVPESAIGYLIRKELEFLGEVISNPKPPFVAVLGGAKVSDKIKVIENLMQNVQVLVIGGGMANTFLKAQGREIGDSLLDAGSLDYARQLLDQAQSQGVQIHLPTDGVAARELSAEAETQTVSLESGVPSGWKMLDIGPQSAEAYAQVIASARTVFWNGPMGVFEVAPFASGTFRVAQALAQATQQGAVTVIGGGDSAAAIQVSGLSDQITHISTGGGASLEFLEGRELPGVSVIPNRAQT